MCAGDEPREVLQSAEQGIDVTVVRDVIAEVLHGRGEDGGDPDGVHPQGREVVQTLDDAGNIADTIAIGVHEAARIDLIERCAAPPVVCGMAMELGRCHCTILVVEAAGVTGMLERRKGPASLRETFRASSVCRRKAWRGEAVGVTSRGVRCG